MNKGFSLIEVLVVILILGILTCLSIPIFQGMTVKGRLAQMLADVNRIERAVDIVNLEGREVPIGYWWRPAKDFGTQYNVDMPEDNEYFKYTIFHGMESGGTPIMYQIQISTGDPSDPSNDLAYLEIDYASNTKTWYVTPPAHSHPWRNYLKALLPDAQDGVWHD